MAATAVGQRWREALDEWRIPPAIRAGAAASPWALPVKQFVERARSQIEVPSGVSYEVAIESLPAGGSVLDVGAGAGAASLALRGRAGSIIAVDENEAMLAKLAELAAVSLGANPDRGREVAGDRNCVAGPPMWSSVTTCSTTSQTSKLFITALTAHARRRVVVEITARHPASLLNPLWSMLHGIERPTRPTAIDAIEVIASTGVAPRWRVWRGRSPRTARITKSSLPLRAGRLCLGPERLGDVEAALQQLGVRPDHPYLGEPMRELVTIWWDISSMGFHPWPPPRVS